MDTNVRTIVETSTLDAATVLVRADWRERYYTCGRWHSTCPGQVEYVVEYRGIPEVTFCEDCARQAGWLSGLATVPAPLVEFRTGRVELRGAGMHHARRNQARWDANPYVVEAV